MKNCLRPSCHGYRVASLKGFTVPSARGIVSSQQVRDRSRQSAVFKMLTGLANSNMQKITTSSRWEEVEETVSGALNPFKAADGRPPTYWLFRRGCFVFKAFFFF